MTNMVRIEIVLLSISNNRESFYATNRSTSNIRNNNNK